MKIYITLVLLFILFSSCKTQIRYAEGGVYRYYHNKSIYDDELILNSDSTFTLNLYRTSCSGKWQYVKPNILIINCDEVCLMEQIQSGYMTERRRRIEILDNNRLKIPIKNNIKIKYIILKKNQKME